MMTQERPTRDTTATESGALEVRLARDERDLKAAKRLRYRVFVQELGADAPEADHAAGLEQDAFDPYFDHLVLVDRRRDPDALDHVVGVYRLLPCERAKALGRFYSDAEYDLGVLVSSGRRLMELGRSCVEPAYRRGPAMLLLWNGLADYVLRHGIEVMFGVASFHGTDAMQHAEALSLLHHHHLAPPHLRVRARPEHFQRMDLIAPEALDRARASVAMPALIRGYLRLGGFVGEGAFIDHGFNTVDICLIMDTKAMSARHLEYYTKKSPRSGKSG
jgi:putative hemolysin